MGEVYRATDTRLGREVALKFLPEAVAQDADRMARFQREAQVLASLNHPNIAAIYGLEQSGGVRALVMELVEGPTLAERLSGASPGISGHSVASGNPPAPAPAKAAMRISPLPLDESLHLAKQIAEALEYAHERGVIHRDLKPANVKITPEGTAKVLDFGLAKATENNTPPGDPSSSPTLTAQATQAGMIMGTAAYMAPEQARGKPVDRRADIWAFGVVLLEMLTGRQPFSGETVSDTLAAVITREPDWERLPTDTPPRIGQLLRRCLTKDPKQRLRDIGEARIAVEEALSVDVAPGSAPAFPQAAAGATVVQPRFDSPRSGPAQPQESRLRRALPWAATAVAALAAVVLGLALWRATRPTDHPLIRLSVDLGPEAVHGPNVTTAVSPDGRWLVFPVRGPNNTPQLAILPLDQSQVRLLPGTEHGSNPFFSPDSQWIGFFADGQLKKISVQGGAPDTLCGTTANETGASWGDDGTIVVAAGLLTGLSRVSAGGGPLQQLTKLAPGEITHRWPQVLPGARAVLFTASANSTAEDGANIEALSLKTGQIKIVQRGGFYGRYLPGGHLVFVHQGVLFGVRFDPERLEVRGAPVPLLDDVAANPTSGAGRFDFSASGIFVYAAGKSAAQAWQMSWLDGSGKRQPVLAALGAYATPRLSPDGRKVAFVGESSDSYVYDLERHTTTRLTFDGLSLVPVWSPDGRHLAFRTTGKEFSISWERSDGAGEPQKLLESTNVLVPWSFSSDGRRLAYFEIGAQTGYDLWTLPLDLTDPDHPKPGKPEPFLSTPAEELVPRFSPDGRWIAYRSDESGTTEIYVRPFPDANGGKWQISSDGGLYAIWAPDGRQLFYETADNHIMVMDYSIEGGSFIPGTPRLWSEEQLFYPGTSNLDLAPDGKRFLVLTLPQAVPSAVGSVHVTMLLNFFDELRRRIPN